jgi:ribosomal protein L37AE/L43A
VSIHICAPKATYKRVFATNCPDCKKRTRMLQFFTPWYGWDSTCLRCGRMWSDGQWMPLDFVPQARQKSIDRAKKLWRRMPPVSENHYGIEESETNDCS